MFVGIFVSSAIAFYFLSLLCKFIIVQVADEFITRREETEWLVDLHSYYYCLF
jgi:hypothetical protein